jgi:HSP20 family protein
MATVLDQLMRDWPFGALTENLTRETGGGAREGWVPATDIYETDDVVIVEMDVPGVVGEDLNIEAVDGKLVVTGERRLPDNVSRRYRNERWTGRFVRSFTLGNAVRLDEVNADYHDGVLTLHLPKPEEVKPRRISINKSTQKQLNK